MGDLNDEPFESSLVRYALSTRQRAKVSSAREPLCGMSAERSSRSIRTDSLRPFPNHQWRPPGSTGSAVAIPWSADLGLTSPIPRSLSSCCLVAACRQPSQPLHPVVLVSRESVRQPLLGDAGPTATGCLDGCEDTLAQIHWKPNGPGAGLGAMTASTCSAALWHLRGGVVHRSSCRLDLLVSLCMDELTRPNVDGGCRMEARRVDRETAESVAGVARLLRRAAALIWVRADREGPRSPAQVLALGLDVAADEAVRLLPDGFDADSPVLPGRIPAGLVSSPEQLLRRLVATDTSWGLIALQGGVSGLVWEASADADGSQHRSPRPATSAKITDRQTDPSRSQCETLRPGAPTEEHPRDETVDGTRLVSPRQIGCGLIIRRIPYGTTGDARPQSSRPASTPLIPFGFVGGAVLIIFALLWTVAGESSLYLSMRRERGC
jgi:hypothetical protein